MGIVTAFPIVFSVLWWLFWMFLFCWMLFFWGMFLNVFECVWTVLICFAFSWNVSLKWIPWNVLAYFVSKMPQVYYGNIFVSICWNGVQLFWIFLNERTVFRIAAMMWWVALVMRNSWWCPKMESVRDWTASVLMGFASNTWKIVPTDQKPLCCPSKARRHSKVQFLKMNPHLHKPWSPPLIQKKSCNYRNAS